MVVWSLTNRNICCLSNCAFPLVLEKQICCSPRTLFYQPIAYQSNWSCMCSVKAGCCFPMTKPTFQWLSFPVDVRFCCEVLTNPKHCRLAAAYSLKFAAVVIHRHLVLKTFVYCQSNRHFYIDSSDQLPDHRFNKAKGVLRAKYRVFSAWFCHTHLEYRDACAQFLLARSKCWSSRKMLRSTTTTIILCSAMHACICSNQHTRYMFGILVVFSNAFIDGALRPACEYIAWKIWPSWCVAHNLFD